MKYLRFCLLLFLALSILPTAHAVTLEQIISRENPKFEIARARLAVGRNGKIYLSNLDPASMGPGFMARFGRDGKMEFSGDPGPAPMAVTANAAGVIATANAHFFHAVTLRDGEMNALAAVNDFTAEPGYFAPGDVEAGLSGDFYGLDQNKNRILRIAPDGKVRKEYSFVREDAEAASAFRVDEKREVFYLQANGYRPLRVVGFDGTPRWSTPMPAPGGFDVDDDGTLYLIAANGEAIKKFDANGKSAGEIKLHLGDIKESLNQQQWTNLRVSGDEIFLKRAHPTEIYLKFDRTSGALLQTVTARFERLRVSYPDAVWISGSTLPFAVEFEGRGAPRFRARLAQAGTNDWRELAVRDGKIGVPPGGGIYQLKVSPEARGWRRGAAPEYSVQSWVELRAPGAKGSANLWTIANRTHFARGEAIPFSVLLRGSKELENKKLPVTLRLVERVSTRVLAQSRITTKLGETLSYSLAPDMTRALRSGEYSLEAVAPELTTVAQPLSIGEGPQENDFLRIFYDDYSAVSAQGSDAWNTPDVVAAHAARMKQLGINMAVERLRFNPSQATAVLDAALQVRLENDPIAAAPQKAQTLPPFLQTLAAYGANGTQQMAILLGNDAGLPLGSDYGMPRADEAKSAAAKQKLADDLTATTNAVKSFAAFRGWSWAANWWLTNPAKEPLDDEGKKALEAARKRAYETGKWEPLIEQIANRNLSFAPASTEFFNGVLRPLAPHFKTAVAAPYRSGLAYPPLTFQNVDEVDLQAQWEQIAPPDYAAHNVDFYKRPGKKAWGHPELWNDAGTGEQILSTLFEMTMRGADGVGFANELPSFQNEDSRSAQTGTASIYRALNDTLKRYGPWMRSLENDDRVAIVVSGRMIKLDEWKLTHFWSVFEAYLSCLHAHHPAQIIFAEDAKVNSLKKFKAVIIAGQKVEIEPQLNAALQAAQKVGVKIFYDATCRADLMKEYSPLGIAFDKMPVESGLDVGGDEGAYERVAANIKTNVPALHRALDAVAPQAAEIPNTEVWATRRKSGRGEYVFVVNNSLPKLSPEHLWRVSLFSATRQPVREEIGLGSGTRAVYDLFAERRITPKNGKITAELASLPMRVYAILPKPIERVALRGPNTLAAGQPFKWWVQARDGAGKAIEASVPIRVRLIEGENTLWERFVAAPESGVADEATIPLDADKNLVLEATELLSGLSTRLRIAVAAAPPRDLVTNKPSSPISSNASGAPGASQPLPSESNFGLHTRDIAVLPGARTAILSALNWDTNLVALDLQTGKTRWHKRIGQYYAFAPQAAGNGFAVQGFDFGTPEGYHLYTGDETGNMTRRYALYGVPPRLPFRMYASAMHDRVNNFIASPDGAWLAASGDLGIAVWNREGKILWQQDDWKKRTASRADANSTWVSTKPHADGVLALGTNTLLTWDGVRVEAREAQNGQALWDVTVAPRGEIRVVKASRDGKILAALSDFESGTIHVIRDQKIAASFNANEVYDFEVAPDGKAFAVLSGRDVKLYDKNGGLRWLFSANGRACFARFSPDGARLAVASDGGTLSVLSRDGALLHERDSGALTVPAWLPDGDLLLANWMGNAQRLDAKYSVLWSTHIALPEGVKEILTPDATPTARVGNWGNALDKPLLLTPNLLAQPGVVITFPNVERVVQNDLKILTDGKPDAPAQRWLWPGEINQWAGLRHFNTVTFALPKPARVAAITFVEDAAHPESWLRDADMEYFDEKEQQWKFLQLLLSNGATHSHRFPRIVETSKLRIVLPFALYGNLRWGEVVLHGEN